MARDRRIAEKIKAGRLRMQEPHVVAAPTSCSTREVPDFTIITDGVAPIIRHRGEASRAVAATSAQGHGPTMEHVGGAGSLPPYSFRAGRIPPSEAVGQKRTGRNYGYS
jgi:hypothetical protein